MLLPKYYPLIILSNFHTLLPVYYHFITHYRAFTPLLPCCSEILPHYYSIIASCKVLPPCVYLLIKQCFILLLNLTFCSFISVECRDVLLPMMLRELSGALASMADGPHDDRRNSLELLNNILEVLSRESVVRHTALLYRKRLTSGSQPLNYIQGDCF